MTQDLMVRLSSRKLWIAIAAILYIALMVFMGAVAPTDGIDRIRDIAIAYMTAEGIIDVTKAVRAKPPAEPPA